MTKPGPAAARIRFDAFEVNLQSGEIFRDGKRIPLANQSFVALATLLERPGQVVSREELRRRLWPDNRVVEFEQGLNAIINRLREALRTRPDEVSVIETLPRRGYRFTGTVQGEPVMADAAAAETAAEAPETPPGPAPRLRRMMVILTAVCALAALAAALLSRTGHIDTVGKKVEPLTSFIGREVAPAFAPDGEHLLFGWDGAAPGSGFDLYTKSMDSERLTRLTRNPATALHAAWSPNIRQIAFARQTGHDSGVYLTAATGESEHLLAPARFLDESFMQVAWSPDGRQIAYAAIEPDGWSHIHLASASGSQQQVLNRPADCTDAGMPTFSANGRELAFVCTSSVGVYGVYVMEDPASGNSHTVASLQGSPQGLAWTSKGDALIVANDSGADSGLWHITRAGILSRLLRSEGSIGPGIAVAAGRIVFVRETRVNEIWRADLASPSSANDSLISSTRTQLVPDYAPDGAHIVFASTRSGSSEIWLADADGLNPVKLTSFNGPLTGAPTWCSDGRRIAFDSRASGNSAIYVLDVLEKQVQRLETSVNNLALPVWSQDCRWLIASDGRNTLYRLPASGGLAEQFTAKRAYRAVMSGSRVIFNVSAGDGVELWAKPVEGGPESPLVGMPHLRYADSWTATAGGIYYTSTDPTSATVSVYDADSQRTRIMRALDSTPAALGGLGISVSRDRRWLLYTRTSRADADIVSVSE